MNSREDPRQQFRRYLAAQYDEIVNGQTVQWQDSGGPTTTQPARQALTPTPPVQAPPTRPVQPPTAPAQLSYRQPAKTMPPTHRSSPGKPLAATSVAGSGQQGATAPGHKVSTPRFPGRRRTSLTYLVRGGLVALIAGVLVALCAATILFYQYYRIASQLPTIGDLRERASQFETTRILDRNGDVLYEILDPSAGRRSYVTQDKISPYLVAAVIATEDKGFYSHPGFDLMAIGRAFLQNYKGGGTVSGASTITQQLARNLLFSPEERTEQSYRRKVREAILAAEITRRYSKDEILELYLNEFYFGNLAYGVEAAAETYFNSSADKLTLGQAAFLAGLLQAPSIYDVYTNPETVYNRQQDVLVLMYQLSQEQGCIYVSNYPQRICLDPTSVVQAAQEIRNTQFNRPGIQIRYPHWVNYVRSLLESQFDPQRIYRSGFQVYTTLDPALQDDAQAIVKQQVDSLKDKNASNGALIALRPSTGEILAMVGSADFNNEAISGQVNMAISPRQPGSTIKPITYLAAFEKGWTPGTLIWDVPTEFSPSGRPDDPSPVYEPVNYDGKFHGPVLVRSALANSYNVAAVKALDFVGIYDDPNTPAPDGFINFARRMGITTLNQPDYGLSLTLGGGDVTLLELTNAYATIANNGRRIPAVAITRILDHTGNVVYEYKLPAGEQVIRPEHAYLMTSILSDNEARAPMFGRNSVLNLPFPSAAKTGTTNDFRDNWTIGYSPDLAVGSWIGNADYSPMRETSGLTGAAPIWSQFMQLAISRLTGNNPGSFSQPGGILEHVICAVSGTEPSEWCPEQKIEIFAADQLPLPADQDLWQKAVLDTWTGLRASQECPDFTDQKRLLNVQDPWAKKWIRKDAGKNWAQEMGFEEPIVYAPERECRSSDPRPKLAFAYPRENDTISTSPLDIYILADATDWFDSVRLDYGVGDDPREWIGLAEKNQPTHDPEKFFTWDLSDLPAGRITLRLTMRSTQDTYAETFLHLNIQVPTPTPRPTETPLPTSTPTQTPTPAPTETPTPTATINWFPKATEITLPPLP
jgi:penicillin-binding protein 1C